MDNLASTLKTGLLANSHPNFPKLLHRSVAAAGIQRRRAQMLVPCGPGGCVHDYVPLYFGSLSPMLLSVINAKNVDQMEILYFEFPIVLAERDDTVFTDASANTVVPPNFFDDPQDLVNLSWDAIDSFKWGERDETRRHQRMAELLVHSVLPLDAAARCVVWNDYVKERVEKIVSSAGVVFPPIGPQCQGRYHYYTKFQENNKTSIVTGPRSIAGTYKATCDMVANRRAKRSGAARFPNLEALLQALRADFGCVSHTAELVSLRSENGIHKRTVDAHTQEVVAKLRSLDEFAALSPKSQRIVELAAYLHDIGKGPRSRWNSNGDLQKVDPDHPVGAMPMMADILVNQVEEVSQEDAETLMKLVCYHDLVGDTLGRDRDEQQIVDIMSSRDELDMLFALGRADATVLVETWWNQAAAAALYDRCATAIEETETR
jgi:HD-GYP domain-containing protein (c-di-GMP phosphodiesterase class II)